MPSFARVAEQHVQTVPHGNLNGVWQKAVEGFTRVAGAWKHFYLASGVNDSTFTEFDTSNKMNSFPFAIVIQPDGRIILGGTFTSFNGATINRVIRLNTDETVDTTFNPGTGANSDVRAIAIQTDGKIMVGGSFTTFNGATAGRVVRLNTDGAVDTTFNPGTGANSDVRAIAIQTDGRIILGGDFTTFNGVTANRIVRLNINGSVDSTFTTGTGANFIVEAIAIQPDGRIVLGGDFTAFNGATGVRVVRLNIDGTPDATFTTGTGAGSNVRAIAIQSNGRILVAGAFATFNGTPSRRIIRLNANGTVDTSFSTGDGANLDVRAIAIQSDGGIILGGTFTTFNGATVNFVVRLNTNGTIDTTFNTGTGLNSTVQVIAIQTDGKVILGGNFTTLNGATVNRVVRLSTDGAIDTTSNTVTGANGTVNAIVIQSDQRIILGGAFTSFNGATARTVARLNTNGTIDTAFNTGTGGTGAVRAIAIQSDGKIVFGGDFTIFNGATVNRVVRLSTDGTIDTTFNTGTGANGSVQAIAIQSDGKIILGGTFTIFNGASAGRVVRLNTDGTIDTTFNPGTGANSDVRAIAIQTDGKIMVGGTFTTFNGAAVTSFVRLNINGVLDATFTTGIGVNGTVSLVAIQSDGRIMLSGGFSSFNGATANSVVRLNTDGTLNTDFTVGSGPNSVVNSMAIQLDGKIFLGGIFSSFNGTPAVRVVRLNTNGSVDTTFSTGAGANSTVLAIAIQSDEKIIIGGNFSGFNQINRSQLARIGGDLAT